jgi:hypothetical protein
MTTSYKILHELEDIYSTKLNCKITGHCLSATGKLYKFNITEFQLLVDFIRDMPIVAVKLESLILGRELFAKEDLQHLFQDSLNDYLKVRLEELDETRRIG